MNLPRFIFSVILPFIIWLSYGALDLYVTGNAVIFGIVIFHLFTVIWIDAVFTILRGDQFTYRMVTIALNGISFAVTYTAALLLIIRFDHSITSVSLISPYVWAVIFVAILSTIVIPLLSSRDTKPLPRISARRDYESPGK